MPFTLIKLPYALDALQPALSKETLEFHYGKHHKTYVETANKLIAGTEFEQASLEDTVKKASGKLFNNAAQIWNHDFYWNSLTPDAIAPGDKISSALSQSFGSVDAFKTKFEETAVGNFGSGWTWLVQKPDGSLAIVNTQGAATPLTTDAKPLLTCDVWEHAYYIDYRNARPKYLERYWSIANWAFAESRLG
ncbi:superoxide dismutase [uncultured Nevskia sp.]|uniref:superoxide dismutase n=1 Tax=uncultured Nevskia sp. TaxID=228950 RepID=UPI00345CDCF5